MLLNTDRYIPQRIKTDLFGIFMKSDEESTTSQTQPANDKETDINKTLRQNQDKINYQSLLKTHILDQGSVSDVTQRCTHALVVELLQASVHFTGELRPVCTLIWALHGGGLRNQPLEVRLQLVIGELVAI